MKEDYSGTLTTHRMVNEIIPPSEFVNGNIVLSKGSYFATSLTLINTASGQPLTKGLDYKYRILDSAATGHSGGKFVYSLIELKTEITTPLSATYQYVGGEYVQQREAILRMLELQQDTDLSKIYYSRLKNRPNSFDVTLDHLHDASEITGKDEEIAALANIHDALQRIGDNVALGTEHDVIIYIQEQLRRINVREDNQDERLLLLEALSAKFFDSDLLHSKAIINANTDITQLSQKIMQLYLANEAKDTKLSELDESNAVMDKLIAKNTLETIKNQTTNLELLHRMFLVEQRTSTLENN